MSNRIAQRLKNFDSSKIRAAFEFSKDIPNRIDLSIGFPQDNTPDYIKEAAVEAISNDHTRYTETNGLKQLRLAIAKKLESENDIKTNHEMVSITPGITMGILLSYLSLLDIGDELLLPMPFFPPYHDLALMLGANVKIIDTAPSFQLTAELIEPLISSKSKVLIINSPNNPSGAVYPESELRKIAMLAQKHGIIVISDEVYEHFSYDIPHFSIGSIYADTLTLNGFSKSYAMTGWRVGYINGPADIVEAINELQQYTVFSSSSVSQHAAIAALNKSPSSITAKYKQKRDFAKQILSGSFEDICGAQGAFYFFLKLPPYIEDVKFINHVAHKGVVLLPGRAFSRYTDYVRIAYGAESSHLERGLRLACESLHELKRPLK